MSKKKQRRKAGRRRKRMRRPARLADARQWLSTPREMNVLRAYEGRYSVDRLCAIRELRQLGVAISEEYEAQVRDSFERRAQARAAKRAAKHRAAGAPASQAGRYEDAALIEAYGNWDGDDASIEGSWSWDDDAASIEGGCEGSWSWDDDAAPINLGEPSFDAGWDAAADLARDRFDGYEDWSIEDMLLEGVRVLDPRVVEIKIESLDDESLDDESVRVRMILEGDPEVLARCAWGVIFTIGALSFADADASADVDLVDHDEWMAGDMLRCLSFDRGRLRFHADHVRGRCMKTTIEIDREGRITLETEDRGEAAMQWISRLLAKTAMAVFGGGDDRSSLEPLPF